MQPSAGSLGAVALVPVLLERYRDAIERQLKESIPSQDGDLYTILRYHLGWVDPQGVPGAAHGGKALRPTMCLLGCQLGEGNWIQALPAAAALELVHNFSLLHDDIQDGDHERRHRPTAWVLWGRSKALHAGNVMRALADRQVPRLVEYGTPPDVALVVSEALATRALDMIEGQYMDLEFEGRESVGVDDYLEMVKRKTGALLDSALYMGVYLARRDEPVARRLGQCGRLLGIAFQARDDILGIWGESSATGKATGADIRRKKKSLPVVYALQEATGDQRKALQAVYAREVVTEEDVETVLTVLDQLDACSYVQQVAERSGHEALRVLQGLPLDPRAVQELEALATFFVTRQS